MYIYTHTYLASQVAGEDAVHEGRLRQPVRRVGLDALRLVVDMVVVFV